MQIDLKIRDALQKAVDSAGSILQFSKKIRVAHTTVRDWLRGKTQKINPNTWVQVEPFLRPYREPKQFYYGNKLTDADNIADDILEKRLYNQENWGADVAEIDEEIADCWEEVEKEFKEKHINFQYLKEQVLDRLRKKITERKEIIDKRFTEILETGQPVSSMGAEGTGKTPKTATEGIEADPVLTPRQKKELLLRLKEFELDRQFGINDDSEGHNPTSGAVAG